MNRLIPCKLTCLYINKTNKYTYLFYDTCVLYGKAKKGLHECTQKHTSWFVFDLKVCKTVF
jgi:hypothetical protein